MRTKKPTSKSQLKLPKKLNNFYLTIPEPIQSDDRLGWMDKILWCKINLLDHPDKGCFASNKYLGKILKRGTDWISKRIAKLKKIGYLYESHFDGKTRTLRCTIPSCLMNIIKPPYEYHKAGIVVPYYSNSNKIINTLNKDSGVSSSKKPTIKYSQKHLNLSSKFLRSQQHKHPRLLKNISTSMKVNGAIQLEMLERIDKYNFCDEIKPALLWVLRTDGFWSKNLLSPGSIRVKGKNGFIKFQNMYKSYLEENTRIEMNDRQKYWVEKISKYVKIPDKKIPLLLTQLKAIKAFYNNNHGNLNKEWFDCFSTFIGRYIEFLEDQTWIDRPNIGFFNSKSDVFGQYINWLKNNGMFY